MQAIPWIVAAAVFIAALYWIYITWRSAGPSGRRAIKVLNQVEAVVADRIMIDPYDLTAQQVASTIRRTKELA